MKHALPHSWRLAALAQLTLGVVWLFASSCTRYGYLDARSPFDAAPSSHADGAPLPEGHLGDELSQPDDGPRDELGVDTGPADAAEDRKGGDAGTHLVYRAARHAGALGEDIGRRVAVDSSGNVFIVGDFEGSIDLGGGPLVSAGGSDVFVASYGPNGAHRWSMRLGGASTERGYGLALDLGGNVFVAGNFEDRITDWGGSVTASAGLSDVFVASLDTDGIHRFSKFFGGPGPDGVAALAVDGAGNITVSGTTGTPGIDFGGGALPGAGGSDIFLASFDASGVHRWSKVFGSPASEASTDLSVDPDGNLALTGYEIERVDFGTGPGVGAGTFDIFVASFDVGGNHRWSRHVGSTGVDQGSGVASDASGNVYLTGTFSPAVDFGGGLLVSAGDRDSFLASFDRVGGHRWSKRFGGTGFDGGTDLAIGSGGEITLVGFFEGTVDFDGTSLLSAGVRDFFVMRLDGTGTPRTTQSFGGSGIDLADGVAVDLTTGATFLTGSFSTSVDLGGGPLVSAGGFDIFLLSLLPPAAN